MFRFNLFIFEIFNSFILNSTFIHSNSPIITVITVAYNAATDIEGTIQSVLGQSYPHVEYLIIDGASTDDTMKIVAQYDAQLQAYSEPDEGLYDAMNKGLLKASGDFVLFLNAGDRFYANDTLQQVVAHYTPETDILYGDVMMVNENREALGLRSELTAHHLPKNLTWQAMRFGMVVSHQAFIVRRTIAPLYISDNLCADIDWVIKCLKKSRLTTHTHICVAEFQTGGLSRQHHRHSLRDRYDVLRKHFGARTNFYNHIWITFRAVFFKMKRGRRGSY